MELEIEFFPTAKFRNVNTPFWTDSTYCQEIMDEVALTRNALRKVDIGYCGNFGHNFGRIQQIDFMRIVDTFYTAFCLVTQTVVHTLPDFQGFKHCIRYLDSHYLSPNLPGFQYLKSCIQYQDSHALKLIFYPSNSYYGSNSIILK